MDHPRQTPDTGDETPDARLLDAATEARVRQLLAAAADPGPMPERVAQRIESLLTDEVALRVDPGPLQGPLQGLPQGADRDAAVLAPLIRQRQRPRPLFALAAVAAAAAVVAVGGSALHLNKRTNGVASLGNPGAVVTTPGAPTVTPTVTATVTPTVTGPIPPPVGRSHPNLHIQVSSTDYTAGDLPAQARQLLSSPSAPLEVLAAEAPTLGPIATEVGLLSCLRAHALPTDVPVHVDLATYEGQPAAVIVVTQADGSTVRVVERTCTEAAPEALTEPVPVP